MSYFCLRCDRELAPDDFDYHPACHPTPEIEKLRTELDAVRAERDALFLAARAVVDTGFFIPAMLPLREAVEKARKAP